MKLRIAFTIIFCITAVITYSQEYIEEANISIELPNKEWSLINKQENDWRQVYYYKRTPVIDSLNRNVIPNISIIVEELEQEMDIVTYSTIKRGAVYFKVIDMFIHEDGQLSFVNALGYKGLYTEKIGEHTVYVIHALNENKGIQLICDVTTEMFDSLDPEFLYTLKSLKIAK